MQIEVVCAMRLVIDSWNCQNLFFVDIEYAVPIGLICNDQLRIGISQ